MTSLKRPGALYDRGRRFRARFGEISVSRRASECGVTKAESLRLDFAKAVACLDEALTLPKDLIVRDSAVQHRSVGAETPRGAAPGSGGQDPTLRHRRAYRAAWHPARHPALASIAHDMRTALGRAARAAGRALTGLATAVLERAAAQLGERVLDIGCGAGTTVLALAVQVGRTAMFWAPTFRSNP